MFNDKNIITVKSDMLRAYIASSIIRKRRDEAKANYAKIGGASPLVAQTEKLLEKVREAYPDRYVLNIMRYTPPFAFEELKWLQLKDVEEVTVIPLYPHYSTTTTRSSLQDFHQALEEANFAPTMHIHTRYYKNRSYNEAIISRILEALNGEDPHDFDLIFSAHSLPQKIIDAGDSYQKEIIENVNILQQMLHEQSIKFKNIHLAYQSRVGPQKWLEPSLDDKLAELRNKRVILYPISFTLDNSETDFELEVEYREVAQKLGYQEYRVAKCLNDSPLFIDAIREIVDACR
jgi:ferrochelatase